MSAAALSRVEAAPTSYAHPVVLAHLTVLELSPPQVIETGAAAGFGLVGLRLALAVARRARVPDALDGRRSGAADARNPGAHKRTGRRSARC